MCTFISVSSFTTLFCSHAFIAIVGSVAAVVGALDGNADVLVSVVVVVVAVVVDIVGVVCLSFVSKSRFRTFICKTIHQNSIRRIIAISHTLFKLVYCFIHRHDAIVIVHEAPSSHLFQRFISLPPSSFEHSLHYK